MSRTGYAIVNKKGCTVLARSEPGHGFYLNSAYWPGWYDMLPAGKNCYGDVQIDFQSAWFPRDKMAGEKLLAEIIIRGHATADTELIKLYGYVAYCCYEDKKKREKQ